MADDDKLQPAEEVDVAGQIGGPSPEVQAAVDAEQKALIEDILTARKADEVEDQRRLDAKIQQAQEAAAERQSLSIQIKELTARVAALEAKP